MTHDEVMDAFEESAEVGERAEQDNAFHEAAGIFRDISGAYSELAAKNLNDPDIFAGMAHFTGKGLSRNDRASEQERASPSERYENAAQVAKSSRAGIQAFRSLNYANGVELCYGLLTDGLLECLMNRRDAAGILTAENALLDAISEYRTICPAGKNREYLFKLLFVQASLAQKEAPGWCCRNTTLWRARRISRNPAAILTPPASLAKGWKA